MTLYFIEMAESKRIKIGYTASMPERRMAQLQTGQPERLILLGSIEGGIKEERSLHRELKQYRVGGEWFDGDVGDIVRHIIASKGPWYRCRELDINRKAMEKEWLFVFASGAEDESECGHHFTEAQIKHCAKNIRGFKKAQAKHKAKYGYEIEDRRNPIFNIVGDFHPGLLKVSEYVTSYES